MTLIQQQRLIGALLLVGIFSGLAYFLMLNANPTEKMPPEPLVPERTFTSSIEAISDNEIEEITNDSEALIDPHNLKSEEPIAKEVLTPVTPKEVKKEVAVLAPVQAKSTVITTDSWFLQLASFSVKKNAQGLQKKVSSLGYTVNIQSRVTDKGTIYRVRIGPDNSKPALEKTSLILNKKLGLKSQIVKNTTK